MTKIQANQKMEKTAEDTYQDSSNWKIKCKKAKKSDNSIELKIQVIIGLMDATEIDLF